MATIAETTILGGIVAIATAGITALIAFFGGKGNATAQLQGTLQDGVKLMIETYQREREADQKKIEHMEGEINQLKQMIESLQTLLRANGIEIPKYRPAAVITMLDSTGKKNEQL